MKKYSIFCFALMAIFYIIQVSVLGYTVYYLNENAYNAFEIGTLLATFGIIAAIMQRVLGYIADKHPKIDFKNILTVLGIIVTILFIYLYLFDKNKTIIGLLFGIIFVCTNSMSPFVNASCFYYKNKGINVDFGIARGFGSLSFAIVSYILGFYTVVYGSKSISFNGIVASILFFIVILFIPRIKEDGIHENNNSSQSLTTDNGASIFHLIKKYPSFFLMVLATIFAMCFQNADCGYLIKIIESIGGDASDLGVANAIAAIVEIPTMFLITRVMKKIKVKKLITIACAFYIVRGFIFCIPSMIAIYAAQVLQMFSFAIIIPSTVYLSDEMMQEEDKNKGQTFIGITVTVGLIIGSFIGGELISAGGIRLLEIGSIGLAVLSFIFAFIATHFSC